MNSYCCIKCFSDPEILRFIRSKNKIGDCEYCQSCKVSICKVDDVGGFIKEGILMYYEDAAEQVGYCTAEGGYQMSTLDIADIALYNEEIFDDDLKNPDVLLRDLDINDSTPYVRKDPYGPPSGDPDEIRYWDNFCKTVKTKQRFTTFLSIENEGQYDQGQPKNFLYHLANRFLPDLIDILQPGTKIYRARINSKDEKLEHEELTSPPPRHSRNSRMSPAGISFFYGGITPEVCIHEVRPNVSENIVIAEFEVINKLFILDLVIEFEARKSIFNPDYNFSYEEYFKPFLEHFTHDISKPIRKTDNEIEYVPTQVFTEFLKTINFKNHFRLQGDNDSNNDVFVNGIKFKSSIMEGGVNLVLFRGPDISTTDSTTSKDTWLFYKGNSIQKAADLNVKSWTIGDQTNT